MKRNNKKGFTIVELVVVIAVIAILAAVLIPTFGGITEKAKDSSRDQEAKNAFTNYLVACDATPENGKYILVKSGETNYYYLIENNQIDIKGEVKELPAGKSVVYCNKHEDKAIAEGATETDGNCDTCGIAIAG